MMASFSEKTVSQYNSSLKSWWTFCINNNVDYCNAEVSQVISYLTERFESGASYATLNTSRSALALVLGSAVASHECINRLLKGIFRLRPPAPKYDMTWDPKLVLDYVSNCFPHEQISLQELSLKTITLLAIATAQRMQTLSLIKCNNIINNDDGIMIKIDDLIKTSRPGVYQPLLRLPYIIENEKICPATALKSYLDKTRTLRSDQSDYLFISFKKPHKKVGSQTLGHWVKSTLQKSGVDISIFGAHSTRHASASAARRAGVSLQVVRRAAGWSESSNVFLKYYNRELAPHNAGNDFVNSLFNSQID